MLFKVKVLFWLFADTYSCWYKEIWQRDLDEQYCCNGRECGCGGMTIRELYEPVTMD